MICRRCQNAMRKGWTENVCYRSGEKILLTKDSCRLCTVGRLPGKVVEQKVWNRSHAGWLTSQTAKENLAKRYGGVRRKRHQVSVSKDVAKKFFEAVPEADRRRRLDHALLVEIGEEVSNG